MLIDFLKSCHTILDEEKSDYDYVLENLTKKSDFFVALMPAVCNDLWPQYCMECTSAKKIIDDRESIYIMPIGFFNKYNAWHNNEWFNNIIEDWYLHDEICDTGSYYNAELEESILLFSNDIQSDEQCIDIFGKRCNAVYLRLCMPNNRMIHIIVLIDENADIWANVFEKYNIKTDMVIHNHKGMHDWFYNTKLYSNMKSTSNKTLLPDYYFEGRYISDAYNCGFELIYEIPYADIMSLTDRYDLESTKIYKTNW